MANGTCTFEFHPLKEGHNSGKLTFYSADLGSFNYNLELSSFPANAENPTFFKTAFGTSQTKIIRFQNFSKSRTEYSVKIDSEDFTSEKTISAAQSASPTGHEITFEVTFEPTRIGNSNANLILTSTTGGEYFFPLNGTGTVSKPLGPFNIKSKSQISIPFKNVFPEPVEFSLIVDNPHFILQKTEENIKAKKVRKL